MLVLIDAFGRNHDECSTIDGAIVQAERVCKQWGRITVMERGKGAAKVRGYAFMNNGKPVFSWPGKCKDCKGTGQVEDNVPIVFASPFPRANTLCSTCNGMGEGPSDNCYVR